MPRVQTIQTQLLDFRRDIIPSLTYHIRREGVFSLLQATQLIGALTLAANEATDLPRGCFLACTVSELLSLFRDSCRNLAWGWR